MHGADAVLLIAAALDGGALRELAAHAEGLGLDALVEVHDERELEAALAAGADLIGINNRDLGSFEVDLAVTERLAGKLPEGCVVVAESGIFTPSDWKRLEAAGAHAFLVGEALMRESDVGAALRRLGGEGERQHSDQDLRDRASRRRASRRRRRSGSDRLNSWRARPAVST